MPDDTALVSVDLASTPNRGELYPMIRTLGFRLSKTGPWHLVDTRIKATEVSLCGKFNPGRKAVMVSVEVGKRVDPFTCTLCQRHRPGWVPPTVEKDKRVRRKRTYPQRGVL